MVDVGTATTIDVVDGEGVVRGRRHPARSRRWRIRSLAAATIAPADGARPDCRTRAIGRDTVEAIRSGVVLGHVAAIKGLVALMTAELGARQPTDRRPDRWRFAATLGAIEGVDTVEPDLLLRGLGMLAAAPDGRVDDDRPAERPLDGRLVLLGVTGSIAAYKAAELVRLLIAAGAEVQVLMTHTAGAFIGPLTLETLSRRRVMLDPLELLPDRRIGHIVAADAADAVLVAPATARWMAAMANGLADDVITATCLATTAPVVVAPAMDGDMYAHPATRANIGDAGGFGYRIVEPEVGPLASGAVGQGRLAEPSVLVEAVVAAIGGRPVRAARRGPSGRRSLNPSMPRTSPAGTWW